MKAHNIILNNEHYPLLEAENNTGNSGLKLSTGDGYIMFGPLNTSHAHIETDRSSFYFNTQLMVNTGVIGSYDEDLYLRRASNSSHQIQISTTAVTTPLNFDAAGYVEGGSFKVNSIEVIDSNRVLKNITRADFANFTVTGTNTTSPSYLRYANIAANVEGSHMSHPYFFNDLANFAARGGVVTIGGLNFTPTMTKPFDASPDFASWAASSYTGSTMTITLTSLPKPLSYGGYIGIAFGNTGWAPASCKIEISTDGGSTWTTRLNDSSKKEIYFTTTGTGGTALNAIRFTLGQPTSSLRLTNIWAYNYNSSGMEEYFLSKGGGTVYGTITTTGNIVNDIGNSGNDSYIELKNTGYTGNVTSLRQNADSTRAELNSTERSIWVQAGMSSSNSAEFRVYTNAVQAMKLDASQNATFAGTISSPTIHNTGVIYLGSTATANDQFATNNGTDIFLGTTSKGLRTYKDLHTNSGNNKYWHAGNDGSGSGLDADTLDGINSGSFLRSDTSDTFGSTSSNQYIRFNCNSGQYIASGGLSSRFPIEIYGPTTNGGDAGITFHINSDYAGFFGLASDWNDLAWGGWSVGSTTKYRIAHTGNFSSTGIWYNGNDGSGSGLDADLLDGQHGSYYLNYNNFTNTPTIPTNNNQLTNGAGYITSSGTASQSNMVTGSAFATTSSPSSVLEYQQAASITDTKLAPSGDWYNSIRLGHGNPYSYYSNTMAVKMTGANVGQLYIQTISNNNAQGWRQVWDSSSDGSGSGLDADTVDSLHAASFLRSDAADTASGKITFTAAESIELTGIRGGAVGSQTGDFIHLYERVNIGYPNGWGGQGAPSYGLSTHGGAQFNVGNVSNAPFTFNSHNVWHAGNDGSGSGLDADLLDGEHKTKFMQVNSGTKTSGDFNNFTDSGNFVISNHANISNSPPNSYAFGLLRVTQVSGTSIIAQEYLAHSSGEGTFIRFYWSPHGWTSWRECVTFSSDGSGSGLDADLLDGQDSGSYLRSNVTDNYTSGTLSFNSGTALKMLNGSNFDASSGDVYANLRVIRNAGTANLDGMYIGYLNSNSGVTRIFGGGQGSGGIYVTGSGVNDIKYNNSSVFWHAGNDGSGTGLDADTLDGYQKSDINPAHSHYRWTGISASGTQARRFVIMRLYGTPAHWDSNWQDIHLKVWSESYEATNLKYEICGDYNGGNQNTMFQLRLKDAGGSSEHGRFRLVLGTPVDAGWDHSGQNTYYVDVYAEAAHYMQFTVAADFYSAGFNVNTLPTSGGATTVVYSSPTVSNITTFSEAKEHSYFANHKIWNDGNHGSGSGLDADTLDTIQASSFLRSDADDTYTGTYLTMSGAFKYSSSGLHFYFTNNTAKRVSFDSDGGIYATGNITAYSDIRVKENIEVIPNALEKVQQIRGVTFTRNDNVGDSKDKRYAGVIAQEIEQILPEVVETNEDGIKSVAYGNMVGLLIEAVKELKQEVEDLKTQLKER